MLESLALAAAVGALLAGAGLASGRLDWAPDLDRGPAALLVALLVPAIPEEVVFRGFLTPGRAETQGEARAILPGLGLFVLWHVAEAGLLPEARAVLLDPAFLGAAAVLGGACATMRRRTDSLWPGILLHGSAVWAWQALLGGPSIRALAG